MKEYPKEPWSLGAVLSTPMTRKFHAEVLAEFEAREKRSIFANFTPADEGRSRVLIAVCEHEEYARRIVACVNACKNLKTVELEQMGGTFASQFEFIQGQRDQALKQRDELLHARQVLGAERIQLEQQRDKMLAALNDVVENWSGQFERQGHLAPEWAKRARATIAEIEAAK